MFRLGLHSLTAFPNSKLLAVLAASPDGNASDTHLSCLTKSLHSLHQQLVPSASLLGSTPPVIPRALDKQAKQSSPE